MRSRDVERLFREHAEPLLGYLAYRTGNPAVAEDLLGEVFERLVRSRRSFDRSRGSERTWVYAIALNCLRDHVRRVEAEGRALQHVTSVGPPEARPLAERISDADLLGRALGELSPEELEVIALRYGADLRLSDIAQVIGEAESTARGRLYRALGKLRDRLE